MKTFVEGIITEYLVEIPWVNRSTMVAVIEGIIAEYLESRLKQVQMDSPSPGSFGITRDSEATECESQEDAGL